MNKRLILGLASTCLSWMGIAEIISGDIWLGLNTIAATAFALFSPLLFVVADEDEVAPEAPPANAPSADLIPFAGARGVAPASTDRVR